MKKTLTSPYVLIPLALAFFVTPFLAPPAFAVLLAVTLVAAFALDR